MKKYSAEEKEMWLEDWKGSGKSLTAYALENKLNPQTLRNWTKEKAVPQGFVEIVPTAEKSMPGIPEILIEKGEIKIHIPIAINRNDLRAVIQSLGCEL
jgi:hypothetical protein